MHDNVTAILSKSGNIAGDDTDDHPAQGQLHVEWSGLCMVKIFPC